MALYSNSGATANGQATNANSGAVYDSSSGEYKTAEDFGFSGNIFSRFLNHFTGENDMAKDAATAYNNQVTNEFNASEAQKNRDFEEYMSSTQYQRAMADAKAAGINPYYILGNGGSSSPSGSAASSSSYSENSQASGKKGNAAYTALALVKIAAFLLS